MIGRGERLFLHETYPDASGSSSLLQLLQKNGHTEPPFIPNISSLEQKRLDPCRMSRTRINPYRGMSRTTWSAPFVLTSRSLSLSLYLE
jgi:hypothetical protein